MNIRRKFIVSHDARFGIIQPQLPQQCYQCYFLFHSPCVGRLSLFVQTAFVTHSDAVLVEEAGVGADVVCGAADMGDAVAGDVEMISANPRCCTWQRRRASTGKLRSARVAEQWTTIKAMRR